MYIEIHYANNNGIENGHVAQWLEHLSDEEAGGSSILPMPTKGKVIVQVVLKLSRINNVKFALHGAIGKFP